MENENSIAYKEGNIQILGVKVEWRMIDPNANFPNSKEEKDKPIPLVERFLFSYEKGGKTYKFDFYNSSMERGITAMIAEYAKMQSVRQTREQISSRYRWGGYDKCPSYKALEMCRAYHLVYGALNANGSDLQTETENFADFCSNFGYDEDSRSAEKIFKLLQESKDKWDKFSPALTDEERKFFIELAGQEEEEFSSVIRKITGQKER